MVITDLGVFTIDKKGGGGMTLIELAPGVSLDEIKAKTEANYRGGAEKQLNRASAAAAARPGHERVTDGRPSLRPRARPL